MVADPVLSIEVQVNGDRVTLVLAGELTMGSSACLQRCIDDLYPGWQTLVLDMAEVTFLDSRGISVIAKTNKAMGAPGRRLELEGLPDQVRRVLEITGVLEILNVRPRHPLHSLSSWH